MKEIAIIGAGGFGREVKMLIDQINEVKPTYKIIGFFDDNSNLSDTINGLPLLGTVDLLIKKYKGICLAFGIGDPFVKRTLYIRLKDCDFSFPTLIHPSVILGKDMVSIGKGTIVCAAAIITCNINISDFVTVNLCCTVGHDTIIKSFSSFMPSVNISGEVIVEENVFVGTGSKIINQINIGANTVIGAGAVIIKDVPNFATVVGNPGKIIKYTE